MNDKKTPDHAPSRYEFSDESRPDETGTIRELIDEINRENWPVRGNRKAKKLDELKKKKETIIIDNGSFKSIRKGIKEIINIKVATAEKRQVPITELKTIYTLYRYSDDKGIELFGRLGLPHLKRPSLEINTEGNPLGNESYIPYFNDLKDKFRREIDQVRLDLIHQRFPTIDMMLIDIEERNTELSRKLRNWFQHDSEALTGVYQELEKSISDFKPAPEAPKNSLHEALYTHIQSLPFQHFVYGFEKAILKSESNISVISIEPDLMSFCKTLGKNIHPLLSKVSSINSFDEFCCSHHLALTAMVQKATGVKTSSEQFKVSIEPARRILHILSNIHLGIKNDTNSISPLDCVAALCTSRYQVGENTPQKIDDRPYWIGCTTQGKNLIRHLGTQRPIEDLYKEDFIPHSVLQILYNRFGFISSALIHSMNYHVAYMKFQIAREKKYAEMLRSNDVDVINRAIGELDFCIEQMLMKFDPSLRLPLPTTTAINKWLEESL